MISDLDLRLGAGVHGLVGPNGAGKTTLIRAMATVMPQSAGRLRIGELDPARARDVRRIRRVLGYLPQEFGFYPRFTVREFIEYVAWLKEMPPAATGLAIDRAMERLDLHGWSGERMGRLSGGVARRVGIAQALVNQPSVLLLDEPTVGLDVEQRLAFRDVVRQLAIDTCVVVSTHLVEEVAAACTDVLVMDVGRIIFAGTPEALSAAGEARPHSGGTFPAVGDSPIERGYTTVLRANRAVAVNRTGRTGSGERP